MGQIQDLYKAINAVSNKLNNLGKRLNDYADLRDNANKQSIIETQDALIEVDESRIQAEADAENALIELDETVHEELADLENALCELSEEG